jgi:tripartite-type tricarboxylate transporter receptor subunit TctC
MKILAGFDRCRLCLVVRPVARSPAGRFAPAARFGFNAAAREREETVALRSIIGRRSVIVAPFALPSLARAQPLAGGRPLRVIVPFGAGGTVDIVGRLVAQELTARLGQSVVVENRTGGGGNIAMEHVARAAPDGGTLLLASPSAVTNAFLYTGLTYDPLTQLAPVFAIAEVPVAMVAAPSFEATSAAAFVALARARPGVFTFGSGGSGTTEHLTTELLKLRTGIDITHVPYRGGAQAMTDVAAGRVSVMCTNISQALPLIRGGQFRTLGVAAPQRHPALPEVPTMGEQGIADLNVSVWWGVMAPTGMPADLTQRLNATLNEALAGEAMRTALERLSATPIGGTVDSFAQKLAGETRNWGQVIRGAGIKAE